MAEITEESVPLTIEINRAGRLYPALSNTPAQNKSNRIRSLQTNPFEDSLPERMAVVISDGLPWKRVQSLGPTNRDTLATAYIESLKQLAAFREDVQRVLHEACRANLEFRQEGGQTHEEARDVVLGGRLKAMMNQASSEWKAAANIATAELFSQPLEVYRRRISASLSNEVANFTHQVFAQLARLVDLELCGLVEWLPNDCCRYHFFRRVVLQGETEQATAIDFQWADQLSDESDDDQGRFGGNRRTTTTSSVKHQIRHARHEHEVMNAIRTSVGNSKVVMPPQIVRLVESIPEWLYPFVEVIDGQMIRERIIERDVEVEDWTQVHVRDEPIVGDDPGIIIGPYVLSGWGSQEIKKELDRRSATEPQASESSNGFVIPLHTAAAVGFSIVSLWLLLQHLHGRAGILFVLLATAMTIPSMWRALFHHAVSSKFPAAHIYAILFTISGASTLLLAEWIVIRQFYTLSWGVPAVLTAVAVISYQVGRLFR